MTQKKESTGIKPILEIINKYGMEGLEDVLFWWKQTKWETGKMYLSIDGVE
ncbi:MAG: hypothetical protein MI863_02755 [Desulfobacterales bacterium]|nr:hypothetical protein [Desulfobacterales bacterium]